MHPGFSSCGRRGLRSSATHELLILVASLVAEHRPQGIQASVVVACELSSRGSQALEHGVSSCGAQA